MHPCKYHKTFTNLIIKSKNVAISHSFSGERDKQRFTGLARRHMGDSMRHVELGLGVLQLKTPLQERHSLNSLELPYCPPSLSTSHPSLCLCMHATPQPTEFQKAIVRMK